MPLTPSISTLITYHESVRNRHKDVKPTHIFLLLWGLFTGSFERLLRLVGRRLGSGLLIGRLGLGSGRIGTSINVPSIEVEQGTVSLTITLDTINIDVDQLPE